MTFYRHPGWCGVHRVVVQPWGGDRKMRIKATGAADWGNICGAERKFVLSRVSKAGTNISVRGQFAVVSKSHRCSRLGNICGAERTFVLSRVSKARPGAPRSEVSLRLFQKTTAQPIGKYLRCCGHLCFPGSQKRDPGHPGQRSVCIPAGWGRLMATCWCGWLRSSLRERPGRRRGAP